MHKVLITKKEAREGQNERVYKLDFYGCFCLCGNNKLGLVGKPPRRLKKFIYYLIDKGNICDIIITSDYTENVEE